MEVGDLRSDGCTRRRRLSSADGSCGSEQVQSAVGRRLLRRRSPLTTLTSHSQRCVAIVAFRRSATPLTSGCRVQSSRRSLNPLICTGICSATSNNMKLVHWPLMGRLLHLVQRGGYSPPRPLLAVPNVTAHPSTASVPITVSQLSVALRF